MGVADKPVDGCMRREVAAKTAATKTASGISVFLLEELGDARVRHAQLKKYLDEATSLIEKSEHRDHFFEVAGHLIHGIPDVLFKLGKALEAASLAANKLDAEEIENNLKPEKIEELEKALEEVRIRQLRRRSGDEQQESGKDEIMNAKTAAERLLKIAEQTEATGTVPMAQLLSLIAALETGKKEANAAPAKVAGYLREVAQALTTTPNPSRFALANQLRRVVGDQMPMTSAQVAAQIYQTANSREDVMKGFKEANPDMSQEELEKAADMWEKHKNVVKDKNK
jgi:hypothetical protein